MVERRLIYESEHVLVFLQDLDSDVFLVTFNEMGFRPQGDRFWGDSMMEGLGFASAGVVSKGTNFYPPADAARYVPLIREAARGRRTFTYGYSHGAYGALKFASGLGAEASLTFSPMASMQPEDIMDVDPAGMAFYDPVLKGGERILASDLAPRSYVFYDPGQPRDAHHAGGLAAMPGVTPVIAPFMEHNTISLISEARIGRALLTSLVSEPSLDRRALRRAVRSARLHSQSYASRRLERLFRRAIEGSRRPERMLHLARAIVQTPDGSGRELQKVALLCLIGDRPAARARFSQLSDAEIAQGDLEYHAWLLRTLNFQFAEARLARALREAGLPPRLDARQRSLKAPVRNAAAVRRPAEVSES